MAMKVRNDVLPYWTNIDATMLTRVSKLVSAVTSFPVQYNKAIVGRNAFAHESGIHQDGMLKHTQTYEIMTPESVGVKQTSLVMGKHSGRHAFTRKLEELGYKLAGNQLEDAFIRFKALADRKKHVYDEDIEALGRRGNRARAGSHQARLDDGDRRHHGAAVGDPHARRRWQAPDRAGDRQRPGRRHLQLHQAAHSARGVLELYQVHAVTEGTDAQAEVSVRLSEHGRAVTAKGADPDTLVASAKAYIGALNKLMVKRLKGMPEAMAVGGRRIHSTDTI